MSDYVMPTYARLPISFSHGEGAYLWSTEGDRYLDALGGIAVCALGHSHPAITAAINEQAGKLLHTSNVYGIEAQQQLAERLCNISQMEKVFFCNSGAEANEAAIKIARRYGHQQGHDLPHIIVMEHSFHGRTLATLSATGNTKAQQGFEPLVSGFLRVAYNDIDAIKELATKHNNIAAILLEPVQGEGGINIPDEGYLSALRQICDQHSWLLMLDEIQSGVGRTGKWFAFQHEDCQPDVLSSAKALGGGVPIGACLARGIAADMLQPGMHGSTFGGNPLASNTALAVINTIQNENLLARINELSERLLTGFNEQLAELACVVDIRGKGLMLAIELDRNCGPLVALALEAKLLINVTAGNVIRLLPPYILTNEQADQIIASLSELIKDFSNSTHA